MILPHYQKLIVNFLNVNYLYYFCTGVRTLRFFCFVYFNVTYNINDIDTRNNAAICQFYVFVHFRQMAPLDCDLSMPTLWLLLGKQIISFFERSKRSILLSVFAYFDNKMNSFENWFNLETGNNVAAQLLLCALFCKLYNRNSHNMLKKKNMLLRLKKKQYIAQGVERSLRSTPSIIMYYFLLPVLLPFMAY